MAQATAITINDGQATPVAVTFNPEQVTPALSVFADRAAGISSGYRRLKVRSSFATGKSVVNRAQLDIEYPVLQTVNGVSTVAYTLRGKVEVIEPDQCTDAERKNLYAFIKNALANPLIQGALRDYDPLF